MKKQIPTAAAYIDQLPEDRKTAVTNIRQCILEHLPKGMTEVMSHGMLSYVVPHSIYPKGYHCDPKSALPFMGLASQKNYIALHHMGLYANKELLDWFVAAYTQHSKYKPDMGKSCIRFKRMDDIPLQLIGELCSKINTQQWIETYESAFVK
jgi:hypothetical protein